MSSKNVQSKPGLTGSKPNTTAFKEQYRNRHLLPSTRRVGWMPVHKGLRDVWQVLVHQRDAMPQDHGVFLNVESAYKHADKVFKERPGEYVYVAHRGAFLLPNGRVVLTNVLSTALHPSDEPIVESAGGEPPVDTTTQGYQPSILIEEGWSKPERVAQSRKMQPPNPSFEFIPWTWPGGKPPVIEVRNQGMPFGSITKRLVPKSGTTMPLWCFALDRDNPFDKNTAHSSSKVSILSDNLERVQTMIVNRHAGHAAKQVAETLQIVPIDRKSPRLYDGYTTHTVMVMGKLFGHIRTIGANVGTPEFEPHAKLPFQFYAKSNHKCPLKYLGSRMPDEEASTTLKLKMRIEQRLRGIPRVSQTPIAIEPFDNGYRAGELASQVFYDGSPIGYLFRTPTGNAYEYGYHFFVYAGNLSRAQQAAVRQDDNFKFSGNWLVFMRDAIQDLFDDDDDKPERKSAAKPKL